MQCVHQLFTSVHGIGGGFAQLDHLTQVPYMYIVQLEHTVPTYH